MKIGYVEEELKVLVNHKYIGKYKSYKSNAKLIKDIEKVVRYLENAKDIGVVSTIRSLAYERLKTSSYSSVRVGYGTKYRLIFEEHEDKITLVLIKISEHYGDH